jgi:LCP family protein required for cell wall assembly
VSPPAAPGLARRRRYRRSWPQRFIIVGCLAVVSVALASAATLAYSYDIASGIQRIELPPGVLDETDEIETEDGTVPAPINVLLYARDTRDEDCIPDDPQYRGGFDREEGNVSDTIMVLRVDFSTNQLLAFSIPRDLWVRIDGRRNSARINTAILAEPDGTSTLIRTIKNEFDIEIQRYVEVSFCSVQAIVNELGGVRVPFDAPVRSRKTGLAVEVPACVTMNGDMAVAYLRVRSDFEVQRDGEWQNESGDDYGRARRLQDFLRRTVQRGVDQTGRNPASIRNLTETLLEFVKIDDQFTPRQIAELAVKLRNLDPNTIRTFTVDSYGEKISGQSVLRKRNSEYNELVEQVMRGELDPAAVPSNIAESTPPPILLPGETTTTTTTAPSSTTGPSTTTDEDAPSDEEQVERPNVVGQGWLPPLDPSCR